LAEKADANTRASLESESSLEHAKAQGITSELYLLLKEADELQQEAAASNVGVMTNLGEISPESSMMD